MTDLAPLLAQASPWVDPLVEYGVLGIIVAILFTFARHAYNREAKRADRLEEENNRLRRHNEEKIIPLLVRAMDALNRGQ